MERPKVRIIWTRAKLTKRERSYDLLGPDFKKTFVAKPYLDRREPATTPEDNG